MPDTWHGVPIPSTFADLIEDLDYIDPADKRAIWCMGFISGAGLVGLLVFIIVALYVVTN